MTIKFETYRDMEICNDIHDYCERKNLKCSYDGNGKVEVTGGKDAVNVLINQYNLVEDVKKGVTHRFYNQLIDAK